METPLHCVDAPAHYKQGEVECVDAMESAFGKDRVATFCTVNAMKYLWRSNEHDDGVETSLRKASWFIHKALQLSRTSQPATPRVNDGNVGWERVLRGVHRCGMLLLLQVFFVIVCEGWPTLGALVRSAEWRCSQSQPPPSW